MQDLTTPSELKATNFRFSLIADPTASLGDNDMIFSF